MGLDTTHGAWNGAYSAFNRWRDKLAETAGYEMGLDDRGRPCPAIDWQDITGDNLAGDWDAVPADPLVILIAHYDSGGVIRHQHCGPLADRLEELLPLLLPDDDGGGHIERWHTKTRTFIGGLRAAHQAGDDLEFH